MTTTTAHSIDSPQAPPHSALVVDDDEVVLRAHVRALSRQGYSVFAARSGADALEAVRGQSFDVIFSDIAMPGISGIGLLEEVRQRDLDVPVVMITGAPTIDTAAQAMEHGALRYLLKPVAIEELVKVANDAVHVHRVAKARRTAVDRAGGVDRLLDDEEALGAAFTRALDSLVMVYQPIVSWSRRGVFAYEALMRSKEPTFPHPGAILDAAERLDRMKDLGRTVRAKVAQALPDMPDGVLCFVNLDPNDILDDELYSPTAPLTAFAHRVVLELTERSSLAQMSDLRQRIERLQAFGFRIAIDDIGSGYSGLNSFTMFAPDVVKLDMALVRDAHVLPTKRTLLTTVIRLCKELGITITAEGIEVAGERDVLVEAGCDLLQGYMFAKPGDAFPTPRF